MHILLVSPRGFCAGVNMAIHTLEAALQRYGTPFYVFHEIVHNNHVVKSFREKGVIFVDTLEEVPDGENLMYSAHGVSPAICRQAQQKHLRVIDATCPLVNRIHQEARKLAENGYSIILIGHAGHDEIIGIVGEAPEVIQTICTPEEVDTLQVPDEQKVACLTQTTLSVEETEEIMAKLRKRFPEMKMTVSSCICYATQNRQRGVKQLASACDLVLIVGSHTSSNSRRLWELALNQGVDAILVDGVEDLDISRFQNVKKLLVTAGASAPEWVVQKIIEMLKTKLGATVETVEICKETLQFKVPIKHEGE
ncbi:MAG: 4-hydroxy-3-methylbut-2-enyl diphosphate reductase [Planctomycetia bacterium]|nr:4-hydroxy-3-methylbut-2-enyl diphosphate reductase [Planctomycetia bacterium]